MTNDKLQTAEQHVYIEAGKPGMGVKDICPECGAAVIAENGCVTCHSCGWSKCAI